MNSIFRSLLIILVLFSQNTNAQKRIKLFNQKDLKDWYAFGDEKGKQDNAANLFSVENNMIRMYGPKAGYLMSEQSFRNFELTVEYKWNTDTNFVRKNNSKNSGVMYHVPAETPDVLWPKGIQFQIKEGATGDFVFLQEVTLNINGTTITPGKSVVSKRFADAENPIGEWNELVVISKNGKITQKLNGKLVNEGTESSVTEGRILLQYEGFPIDFRKVTIKKHK
ncbi:3-keto-disaccharide hydrolase [Flavobacterium seoulense]|uniref:3-keto-alpha-glucoside-1,2-lyase/3-keto-2-hydroxy-glucal hydratase domain-containing protein n=1 Tax=Flavobacterium seoulense TaxID=1492738 RepID=A0A066WJJ1_9FLAO|nr:DUF1080 domain-containing protein [Flavobacterium seoulense]KDN54001.1 hypothetical protein FEM21_28180 [Flavobacterium seoulense]